MQNGPALLGPMRTRTLASDNSLIPDYATEPGGGLRSSPSGMPMLGRYNSVLNDGLFSSLQVKEALPCSRQLAGVCMHSECGTNRERQKA